MAAHQAHLSLGFSRQEHWSRLPFPSPTHESEVPQSCPTHSDPMDCSLPGSSIHEIFQERVLEWVTIAKPNSLLHELLLQIKELFKKWGKYSSWFQQRRAQSWSFTSLSSPRNQITVLQSSRQCHSTRKGDVLPSELCYGGSLSQYSIHISIIQ